MHAGVKLNQLTDILGTLDYPTDQETVSRELGDTILEFADGEERLRDVLERSTAETFETEEELDAEIRGNLPVRAVGEPGQSEGEG